MQQLEEDSILLVWVKGYLKDFERIPLKGIHLKRLRVAVISWGTLGVCREASRSGRVSVFSVCVMALSRALCSFLSIYV